MRSEEELKKMKELLPDYLFNRLKKEDKLFFEDNISNYEDLEYDLKNADKIFSMVDKMDYNQHFENKAKLISVKVQERLAKQNEPKLFFRKYLIPAISMVAVLILYLNGNFDNLFNNESENPPISIVKASDVQLLIDENNSEDILAETLSNNNLNNFDNNSSKLSSDISNEIASNLFADNDIAKSIDKKNDKKNSYLISSIHESELINSFGELDENEFQNILE
jgi:hypothetical protein